MDDKTEGFALGLIIAALLYLLIQGHLHKSAMAGSRAGGAGFGASSAGGSGGAGGSSVGSTGSGGCGCGGTKAATGSVISIGGESYSGSAGY